MSKILITGAGSGLGKASSIALAKKDIKFMQLLIKSLKQKI